MEICLNEHEALDFIEKNRKQLTKEINNGESRVIFNSKDKKISIVKQFDKLAIFNITYGEKDLSDLICNIIDRKFNK